MENNNNTLYLARNEEGYVCSYDTETHKCIGVIETMGDIPLSIEKRKSFLGKLDPKYINV